MATAKTGYATREIAEFLDWPTSRVYTFVRAGIITPGREGRFLRFSFRDLVVLRAADTLIAQDLPPRRVRRALRQLRRGLPDGRPLSATSLAAAGDRIAMREGDLLWELETGQAALDFSRSERRRASPAEAPASLGAEADADAWFDIGVEREEQDLKAAIAAYRQALALDPDHVDARVNLGRIRQGEGDIAGAVDLYRQALDLDPTHAIARFNLGTACEDEGQTEAAIAAYEAVAAELTDARYNLARLYEQTGRRDLATRELTRLMRAGVQPADGD